ncbi:MAG: hypothetical protein AAF228_06190 [Pseudomonadota bacterium]
MKNDLENSFTVLASLCGSCGCGCPTVLESSDGENIVVVGELNNSILGNEVVSQKIGENETAVVIPRSILLEAMKSIKA